MQRKLVELLICPGCGRRELALQAASAPLALEVETGILRCGACARQYPVVDGIARLLPDSWAEHRDRVGALLAVGAEGGAKATPLETEEIAAFRRHHAATRDSFGFEWLRYEVTGFEENERFFRRHTGLDPAELAGKRVLDAGCGMGRFLEVAASAGAEVVGLDLSRAVERARRETRHGERAQFVQGDILNPPFAPESFDVVFSIGVLHHTPDTRRAFRALVPLLKPGGRIAIWVYRTFQPEVAVAPYKRAFAFLAQLASDGTRLVTTRLPHRVLHYLCYAAVPLGALHRAIARHRVLKYLLWPLLLPPVSIHPDWKVRVCDTFDWLSPRFQWKHTTREVAGWFAEAGLEEIRSPGGPVSVSGVKPAERRDHGSFETEPSFADARAVG